MQTSQHVGILFLVAGAALICAPALSGAIISDGLVLNWDAATPGSSPDDSWVTNAEGTGTATWGTGRVEPPVGDNNPPDYLTGNRSAFPGITQSYQWNDDADGGDGFNTGSFNNSVPDASPVSVEIWMKPAVLDGTGKLVLEDGAAGDGMSFFLSGGDTVQFNVGGDTNTVVLTADAPLTNADISDFIQVVGVADTNQNKIRLYVNGSRATTEITSAKADDWGGGNPAGLGWASSGTAGDESALVPYLGEIAIVRVYGDKALTDSEVTQNYTAVTTPEPGLVALFTAALAVALLGRRRV